MNIVFVVNGNEKIGMGHINRSLPLAKELSKQFKVCFFSVYSPKLVTSFKTNKIKYSFFSDKEALIEGLATCNNKKYCIITDSYELDELDYLSISTHCEKLISILDYPGTYLSCDLIISPNICFQKDDFLTKVGCEILTGKEYIIIKDEILKCDTNSRKDNMITVSLGGSDLYNSTPRIIKALNMIPNISKYEINILIGPFFSNRCDILENNILKFNIIENCSNLGPLLAKSAYAIISGGVTLHECLYLETKPLVFIQADNQVEEVNRILLDKKLVYGGYLGVLSDNQIEDKIKEFFTYMSTNNHRSDQSKKYIDGDAKKRVVRAIKKLTSACKLF